MATTGNRLLKQCKVKFANCYQLNGGVSNIPVFVDKFLNRLSFGHLSFDAWYHLSGQFMLFSVVFAGVGICKGILDGRMLGENTVSEEFQKGYKYKDAVLRHSMVKVVN